MNRDLFSSRCMPVKKGFFSNVVNVNNYAAVSLNDFAYFLLNFFTDISFFVPYRRSHTPMIKLYQCVSFKLI